MIDILRKVALYIHTQYNHAYSFYKLSKLDIPYFKKFNAIERDFYLKLRCALKGKDIVVYDIGAARGDLTGCLEKLSNISSIQSFEPNPKVFHDLQLRFNSSKTIQCHNIALGTEVGVARMNISKRVNSSSLLPMAKLHQEQFPGTELEKEIEVPIVRLDEYVKENKLPMPDVVKIDVQGFEINVIKGGIETIKNSKFCILEMSFRELYEGSPLFDDLYMLMREMGFQLVSVSDPLVGLSGEQLQLDGIFQNTQY